MYRRILKVCLCFVLYLFSLHFHLNCNPNDKLETKKFILDSKSVNNCKKVCWQFGFHHSEYVKRIDNRYDCICKKKNDL